MADANQKVVEAKVKKAIYKKWWFWAIIVLLVIGMFGLGGNSGEDTTSDTTEQTQEEASSDSILLTFGDLGEYGTKETVGEKEYIAYRVPSGTYTITNKSENMAQVTIYKDGTQTNEDGVEEQIMSDTKPIMLDVDASETVTINDGEYIEIYDNEVIELVAQQTKFISQSTKRYQHKNDANEAPPL